MSFFSRFKCPAWPFPCHIQYIFIVTLFCLKKEYDNTRLCSPLSALSQWCLCWRLSSSACPITACRWFADRETEAFPITFTWNSLCLYLQTGCWLLSASSEQDWQNNFIVMTGDFKLWPIRAQAGSNSANRDAVSQTPRTMFLGTSFCWFSIELNGKGRLEIGNMKNIIF